MQSSESRCFCFRFQLKAGQLPDTLGDNEIESYSYTNRGWQQSSLIQYQGTEWYGFNISSFASNGDVLAASDSVNGNWTYSYDEFNRLSGSNQNSGAAAYSYAYDRFGNRWQQNGPQTMSLSFSGNNNRMDGYTYDTAGNLLNDGSHSYTYDAENHLIRVDGGSATTYTYDANGRRVEKTHDYTYSSMGVSDYVYDLRGHLFFTAWENPNGSGSCCNWDLYFGDRHLFLNPGARFSHTDWLGTERLRRSTQGFGDSCTSLPFGDALSCVRDPDRYESILHFTGQQRDFESGLDNFGARFYASQTGRFISPDWSDETDPVPYSDLRDPQTLNLYSYVRNNPLRAADPDGHGPGANLVCESTTIAKPQTEGGTILVQTVNCHPKANTSGLLAAGGVALGNEEAGPFAWAAAIGLVGTAAVITCNQNHCLQPLVNLFSKSDAPSEDKDSSQEAAASEKSSPGKMQKQVERDQAPSSVDRVDSPRFPYEKPHVEFKDGNALNDDGSWKHGGRELTNAEKEWITKNGWQLPR